MYAYDLMTPHPRVVTGSDTIREAARLMRDLDVGILPVVDDRAHLHLRGVITDRDIAIRCTAEGHSPELPVEDFMTSGHLATVVPYSSFEDVLWTMEQERVRRLPVVENGRLVGMIAQADVALKEGPLAPLQVEEMLERISAPLAIRT